jgi:HK97 family phage major capsid protein
MSARIVEKIFQGDPFRQLCNVETIGTDALELTEDLDEAGDGWEGETVVGAETTTPQLKKKRIQVFNQYARPRATQKLLEDSSINIEQWLANKVGQKMLRTEGAAFVTGDGVARPRGFLTYANGTAYGQVEQVALGAAATVTTDGLIDLEFSLMEEYLMRATWAMNRLTVASIMKLKDGDGQYIWRPGILAGQPSTLLGLPMRMSTTMPVVAANALSIAIADWNEFYTIVDRLGITVQRDPYTVKPFVEFYTRRRVGGDVVNYQAGKIGVVSV